VEETGEYNERRLNHSDGEAEKFYRDLIMNQTADLLHCRRSTIPGVNAKGARREEAPA
jgi:hypothetical protein